MHTRRMALGLLACSLGLCLHSESHALLVDDFESLLVGRLNGQAGWNTSSSVSVVRDAQSNDNVMRITGSYAIAFKSLGTSIPDDDSGTLFFRFQFDGSGLDHTFGLSDLTEPVTWSDYESMTRLIPDEQSNIHAQGRDADWFRDFAIQNNDTGILAPDTWYHLWMVSDNQADTVDYYLQGGDLTNQQFVAQGYNFRNGTTDPLTSFLALTGYTAGNSVYVDDIHIAQGTDLTSPVGAPATTGAVVIERPPAIGLDLPALYEFAGQRLMQTHASMPAGSMPEISAGGAWNQTSLWHWTSGFYAGQLWMMYRQTNDPQYLNAALSRTADLEGQEYNDGNHDIGFRVFNSFGQGYRSLEDGDPVKDDYLARILIAAESLAGRYNPAYQAIDSWGGNQVIIDNMMNLELLFWSAEHTADPEAAQRWYDIAVNHATTTRTQHVRPDGSSFHVVQFDPNTGDVVTKWSAQGYDSESTWSRGQSWGIYGFTMAYRYTDDTQFLDTAVSMAEFWLSNIPEDGLIPYDFAAPGPDVPLDTSSAAIASAGLLELMGYVDTIDALRYFDAAQTMLRGLSSQAALTYGLPDDAILTEASYARDDHHMGLIFGDYYFIEALQRFEAILAGLTPGDADLNGTVDLLDLSILASHWSSDQANWVEGDFNLDGTVDLLDLSILAANFQSTTTPEPASLALFALAGLNLFRRKSTPNG